jgi:hypothetical protein
VNSGHIRFDRLAICTAAAFSAAIFSSRSLNCSRPAARPVVCEMAASVGFSAPPWGEPEVGYLNYDLHRLGGVGPWFGLGGRFHVHFLSPFEIGVSSRDCSIGMTQPLRERKK